MVAIARALPVLYIYLSLPITPSRPAGRRQKEIGEKKGGIRARRLVQISSHLPPVIFATGALARGKEEARLEAATAT